MRCREAALLILLVPIAAAGSALAAELAHSSLAPGQSWVRDSVQSPVFFITQNVDPNSLVSGLSVACQENGITTDNEWLRLFDLDDDHGLNGEACIESVDYGIESAVGSQQLTLTAYCLDEGLPFLLAFLETAGSNTVQQPEAVGEFFNANLFGCCHANDESLAIGLRSDDCLETGNCQQLFIGMNDAGQTGPTYILTEDCGIFDPVDLSALGFANAHLVMVGHGILPQDDPPDDGGGTGDGAGDVPATTGAGLLVLLLALLAAGVVATRLRHSG